MERVKRQGPNVQKTFATSITVEKISVWKIQTISTNPLEKENFTEK